MQCFVAATLAGACLFAFPSITPSQTIEIRGATITLLPKTIEIEKITIENRRNSPLVAWELRWPTVDCVVVSNQADFSWRPGPRLPGAGPIQPNERRTIDSAPSNGPRGGPVTLQVAVFADGYINGMPEAVERWQRERREHLETAHYWLRAFAAMPRDSEDAAFLGARVAERTTHSTADRSGTRGRLAGRWRQPHWCSKGAYLNCTSWNR